MQIATTQATKMVVTGVERLDPVTVIAEDLGPERGKITIDCFGQAWCAYWGAMGCNSIAEFFCRCDEHYLAENLSEIKPTIFDADAINEAAELAGLPSGRDDPWNDWDLMVSLYGPDPFDWSDKIPKTENPDYTYLCRIIKTVQQALKICAEQQAEEEAEAVPSA